MNHVNPKKLLQSKWTAINTVNKEKHFLITEVDFNEEGGVIHCLIEAVMTRRSYPIQWRELGDSSKWRNGWK